MQEAKQEEEQERHSQRGRSVNGRRVKARLKRRIDRASISPISQCRIPVSFGSGLMAPEAEFNRGLSAIDRRFNAIRKSQGTVNRLAASRIYAWPSSARNPLSELVNRWGEKIFPDAGARSRKVYRSVARSAGKR